MIRREYQDDSDITEITIQPDGRIYTFGLSTAVAAMLNALARPEARNAAKAACPAQLARVVAGERSDDRH